MYTGELDLNKQSGEDILELLIASDELLVEELFIHVQDYLIEKQIDWLHENLILVLHAVFKLDNCKLKDYCLESICENPMPIVTSKSFLSIDKEILFTLLKRDDLHIKEVAVWEYLIKWGIEQTPSLENSNNDGTKWNNENYEAMKETLNQFIPLIRFVGISREDFLDKVYPYRAIIPKNIYKEIGEFYSKGILPSLPIRIGKIESNIIKPKLTNIIVNWIDKQDGKFTRTENDPLYKFELIYRGSRDGINNSSFKRKCKGQMACLVLIKAHQSDKIFGGYSSIGLNSFNKSYYQFYKSSDNFIFSFENNNDIQNMKIGHVVDKDRAILECNGNGFNFGWGSLCIIGQNLYVNNWGSYENIVNDHTSYTIEEIETFIISNQ